MLHIWSSEIIKFLYKEESKPKKKIEFLKPRSDSKIRPTSNVTSCFFQPEVDLLLVFVSCDFVKQ